LLSICHSDRSKILNHKDLEELGIYRRHAPTASPQERSASRGNIFARVARESAINEVLLHVQAGCAFARNSGKDVGRRPPLRKRQGDLGAMLRLQKVFLGGLRGSMIILG